MNISEVRPLNDLMLEIVSEEGLVGVFDLNPYLGYEAFSALKDPAEFVKVSNGGYFVEWDCGADLSADTIEAGWRVIGQRPQGERALEAVPGLGPINGNPLA